GCDPVIVVGRRDEACQRALDFGKATHVINNREQSVPNAVKKIMGGGGVSYAIEAIGDNGVLRDCLDSLAPGGKVGLYGVAPDSQGRSPLCDDPRVSKAGPIEAMVDEEVLRLVRQGIIPAREFVSHELGFTECAHAFELLANRKAFKVGLKFT
ncbi:MAG: zinc-binding dehydrogenase, partial [Kiritimatiellota bacterium]|nr:zinc-binding dehydrogenase [Kiritimatiellota bacterium]